MDGWKNKPRLGSEIIIMLSDQCFKQGLTCVSSLVNLEVFRPREDFSASREGAREGLLSRVHADVVDQFVLRLKGFPFPWTFLPKADVAALLRSADVLHRDVVDQLVHGAVSFGAGLFLTQLLVDPLADELLLYGLPHVS